MAPEKHIFVVNPVAGGGTDPEDIRRQAEGLGIPFEIYVTKGPRDASKFVKKRAETGEELRFYACGGDGTLKEVAQGAAGLESVSIACYAVGSGNDFVRVWGGKERFLDLPELVNAEARVIDAISVNDQICLNACHFGFDSMVADTMNAIRSKKIIGGKNAYTTGVIKGLISGMRHEAVITADGEELCSDAFLLCSVCNGGYVGGGGIFRRAGKKRASKKSRPAVRKGLDPSFLFCIIILLNNGNILCMSGRLKILRSKTSVYPTAVWNTTRHPAQTP